METKIYTTLTFIPIQLADNGMVRVTFVDYGNPESVKVQEIRTHLINTDVPIQCIKARLNNVVPVSDGFCASWFSSSSLDLYHSVML